MNKKLILSAVISVLLLSGCGTENDTSETADTTSTAIKTESNDVTQVLPDDSNKSYDNYNDFVAEYTKTRSNRYLYSLPNIVNTWETKLITLGNSNYTLYYDDVENGVSVMLEIAYYSSYGKISDFFDGIGFSMGVETVEMYDRYSVQHYTESDSYSLIGITGEENILYTLVTGSHDETKDPVELLKEYKEILEL